jgi:hypothetical protein
MPATAISPPPPPAQGLLGLLLRLVPGKGEKHIVETGAVQLQIDDGDPCHVQVSNQRRQFGRAVTRRSGDATLCLVDRRLARKVMPGDLGGARQVGVFGQGDLDAVAPELVLELIRGAFRDDLPRVDDGDLVGELVRLFQVLSRQQDRRPLVDKGVDHVPDLPAAARIEAGRRFIEEEDRW